MKGVVRVQLSKRRIFRVVALLAAANLVFIVDTFIDFFFVSGDGRPTTVPRMLVRHLNLGFENVTAAWYSSMLMLLASVSAYLCFAADRNSAGTSGERRGALAWLAVVAAFALLSLDEVGSLHERIGGTGSGLGWVHVLGFPIAVVAVLLIGFALLKLPRDLVACVLFVTGVVLYASILVQEHSGAFFLPAFLLPDRDSLARYVWEEGTELFASLFVVAATATYALNRAQRRAPDARGERTAVEVPMPPWIVTGAVVFCVAGYAAMLAIDFAATSMPEVEPGMPRNWFPSALAALAALIGLQLWDSSEKPFNRLAYAPCTLLGAALSLYYGAHWKGWLNAFRKLGTDAGMFVNAAFVLIAFVVALALVRRASSLASRLLSVVGVLLIALAFSGWQRRGDVGALDYAACATLFVALMSHLADSSHVRDASLRPAPPRAEESARAMLRPS